MYVHRPRTTLLLSPPLESPSYRTSLLDVKRTKYIRYCDLEYLSTHSKLYMSYSLLLEPYADNVYREGNLSPTTHYLTLPSTTHLWKTSLYSSLAPI